jgi:hypothetical protein
MALLLPPGALAALAVGARAEEVADRPAEPLGDQVRDAEMITTLSERLARCTPATTANVVTAPSIAP